MSKLETPMTLRYWKRVGGTLLEEFPAVKRAKGRAERRIDALILPDEPTEKKRPSEMSVDGKRVIVVQAKASRLGMSLMGQALFSIDLVRRCGAIPIKAVALCTKDDEALRPLLDRYNVEVVVDDAPAVDARALLQGLVGQTIRTLTGKPNTVIAVQGDEVIVGTSKSPAGEPVPIAWVQEAMDRLIEHGEIEISVKSVRYRSAFVGAVLATLPRTVGETRPRRIRLVEPGGAAAVDG